MKRVNCNCKNDGLDVVNCPVHKKNETNSWTDENYESYERDEENQSKKNNK